MLRSVIQTHKNINYVFMGSSESMIREIFEKKDSPFYRFGSLITLGKIPTEKFRLFLEYRFTGFTEDAGSISEAILKITDSHPFLYTTTRFHGMGIVGPEQSFTRICGIRCRRNST